MSRRIGSTPFREILPQNIAVDPAMRNAADALDCVLNRSVRGIPDILFFAQLARDSGFEDPVAMLGPMRRLAEQAGGLRHLPEPILDLLAWQLHVDGYGDAIDLDCKRRLVQLSLLLHRRKGTPWSVRNALEAAFGMPTELSEWCQYGGKPYFFRVAMDVTGRLWGEDYVRRAYSLIFEYKNVRSWLEYLATRSKTPLNRFIAAAVRGYTGSKSRLFFMAQPYAPVQKFVAASSFSKTTTALRLFFPGRQIRLAARQALCAHGFTLTTVSSRREAQADAKVF